MKYSIDGKYLLYLGTLEPRKNIETIIKANKFSWYSSAEKLKDIYYDLYYDRI